MADSHKSPSAVGPGVFLVGLDGASWKVMDPLLNEGALPRIAALIEHGVHGRLDTLDCLISPVIWTSIGTGKVPAKHGIQSFSAQKVGPKVINLEWRWKRILVHRLYPFYHLVKRLGLVKSIPPSSMMRTAKTMWEILESKDHPTGVIGWWGSWPPDPLSAGVVSDRAYHLLQASTYPESLLEEVSGFRRHHEEISASEARRFIGLAPIREAEFTSGSVREDRWFGYAYLSDMFFGNAARHVIRRNPGCSYFIYLRGIDLMEHAFWHYIRPDEFPQPPGVESVTRYGDAVANYYSWVDRLLGELLDSLEGQHLVVVVSDHGMRAAPSSDNPGDHDQEAVLIASGPNVAHRSERIRGHVLDIVPTVLHLMGLPVAKDMDGRVLTELIEDHFLEANPIQYIDSYEDGHPRAQYLESEADEEIIERLRGLGYID